MPPCVRGREPQFTESRTRRRIGSRRPSPPNGDGPLAPTGSLRVVDPPRDCEGPALLAAARAHDDPPLPSHVRRPAYPLRLLSPRLPPPRSSRPTRPAPAPRSRSRRATLLTLRVPRGPADGGETEMDGY